MSSKGRPLFPQTPTPLLGIPASQPWQRQDLEPIPVQVPDSVQLSQKVPRPRPEVTGSNKQLQVILAHSKPPQKVSEYTDRFVFQTGTLKQFSGSKIPIDDISKLELNKVPKHQVQGNLWHEADK